MKISIKLFSIIIAAFIVLFSMGCGDKSDKSSGSRQSTSSLSTYSDNEEKTYEETEGEVEEEKYPDGTYCADVKYSNPNTGTQSTYTLLVEIEGNEVTKIYWPNGGWLDEDHFFNAELDEDGNTSFTSDRGIDYEVQITGSEGDCFTDDGPTLQQCRGITEDGTRCENMTDNENGLCWMHQDQE